jgi:hypothetical protein
LYALERWLIRRPTAFEQKPRYQAVWRLLQFFQLALLAGMQWIGQYRHARDVRKRLTQQLDPLPFTS